MGLTSGGAGARRLDANRGIIARYTAVERAPPAAMLLPSGVMGSAEFLDTTGSLCF